MDFGFLWDCLLVALRYTPITLYISLMAFLLGLVIGIPLALVRFFRVPYLARTLEWLTSIVNSIPLLLTLTLAYLLFIPAVPFLGNVLGQNWAFKDFNREWIAIFVLGLFAITYVSEAVRAALIAIPRDQWEAAASTGLSRSQTLRAVILPQVTRSTLPLLGNTINQLIKGSALVSAVSVVDLLNSVMIRAQSNYRYLEAYVAAAIVYYVICSLVTFLFNQFSKLIIKGEWAYDTH